MRLSFFSALFSLSLMVPGLAHAMTSDELLHQTAELIDSLNSGHCTGAEERILELRVDLEQQISANQITTSDNSIEAETFKLVQFDLDGAGAFLAKLPLN